jgi:hypothetical protein
MEHTGLLSKIDSRTFVIDNENYYARKAEVEKFKNFQLGLVTVTYEEDAGYKMIKDLKPEIPVTTVEKTSAQPQQAPSQNMTTADAAVKGTEFVQKTQPRSQKDFDIMYQWSLGQATSPTWSNCNDALVLSTEQMKARIRDLSAWYRNEVLGR